MDGTAARLLMFTSMRSVQRLRFARLVGPDRVIASTDCGFGGRTHPQIAWAKLRSLCEGAALASKALS